MIQYTTEGLIGAVILYYTNPQYTVHVDAETQSMLHYTVGQSVKSGMKA